MSHRLLLLCSRLHLDAKSASEVLGLLKTEIPWRFLLRSALEEGVAPLLCRNLRRFKEAVPSGALEKLEAFYYATTAWNIRIFEGLKPLLRAISEAQLRVAVTKGARLVRTIYPEIGLRGFVDIDFVVHRRDWPCLEKLFRQHGFSPVQHLKKEAFTESAVLDWTYRPLYAKGKLSVENHFDYLGLQMPFASEDDFWGNVRDFSVDDVKAKALSPEYELCYLCLHAQQHSYTRLIWLTDIAEMAARGDLDWKKIISICFAERISAPVYYGLHLTNHLWPGTVSKDILKRFPVSSLERRLLRFCWPEDMVMNREASLIFPYYAPTFFSLLSRKKIIKMIRTMSRILFPPESWVAQVQGLSPHSPRVYLHYAWRAWRPFWLFVRRLLKTG